MLCYYGSFKVDKVSFNRKYMILTFLEWMQTTKNKISSFIYNGSEEIDYKEEQKEIHIHYFQKDQILGIQYKTNDNYKNNYFKVEALYDEKQDTLSLLFFKELKDDSKHISTISLPKIFTMYLQEIKKDEDLYIEEKPYFTNYKRVKAMLRYHHALPIVLLYKDERCRINPVYLAKRLYGIAHVVVVNTKDPSLLETMKVYYLDGTTIDYSVYDPIYEELLSYLTEEYSQEYTYDDLILKEEEENYLNHKREHEELTFEFWQEVERKQKELLSLQQLNHQLQEEYHLTEEKYEKLNRLDHINRQEGLIYLDHESQETRKYIYQAIQQAINGLEVDNHMRIFRRKDILESIMEAMENEN